MLEKLKTPVPCKWRVQSAKNGKATCVAYIDARQVMDILDDVVGAEKWQSRFVESGGLLFCEIGIKIGDEWVWKSDAGTESNIEKEKGHASDALKRAGVQWGIGRFLYDLDLIVLKTVKGQDGKEYPADTNGKQIWGGDALTDFCEGVRKMKERATAQAKPPAKPTAPKTDEQPLSSEGQYKARLFKSIQDAVKDFPDRKKAFNIEIETLGGKFSYLEVAVAESLCLKYVGTL